MRHGENSNTVLYGGVVQNTVFTSVPVNKDWTDPDTKIRYPTGCFSGSVNGIYSQCWPSFSGYASISYIDLDSTGAWTSKNMPTELGPVLWPSKPFLSNGKKTSSGVYHPTMFYNDLDGYVYVYYSNPNGSVVNCMSTARILASDLAAGKTNFKNYYNGSFSESSLPPSIAATNVSTYSTVPGGRADRLMQDTRDKNYQHQWISVARVQGTNYFVAAREVTDWADTENKWKVGLSMSTDLIHWSELQILARAPAAWGDGYYAYPTLMNKDATSNSLIDPNEFYILGKHANNSQGYELSGMKMKISNLYVTTSGATGNQVLPTQDISRNDTESRGNNYSYFDSKLGDIDGDGIVNGVDFILFKNSLIKGSDLLSDMNMDGLVNGLDFVIWKNAFLKANTIQ